LVAFFLAAGCATVDDARTPQQKNLNAKAFETISAPVDDFLPDEEVGEFIEDEIDKEPPVGEKFYKPITISVAPNMKIREALTQMANSVGVDVFIVNDVEESISFSAKNRPFLDVLKDICASAGLRYTIDKNSVKIEIDSPTVKTYNAQFLNIQRDSQSSVSVSTDIFSNQSIGKDGATVSSGSAENGSKNSVSGVTKNDFWAELEASLKTIVGENDGYFSIHRQAGLITVCATQPKHNEIRKYLRLLKDATESQVLIEAKILEVNLKDEYKNGINWNIVRRGGAMIKKEYSTDGLLSFGVNRSNLNAVIGLIENFGAIKTLSSPRITVLNNQSAILKVAQNEVIYIPEMQRQYATVSDNRSTDFLTTTIRTIPIGLIMSVLPSIDKKNNSILLNIRPTVSRINDYKKVPFFYRTASLIRNANQNDSSTQEVQFHEIPVVDVREMDSVLKLNSGQIVVMGGLMQETSRNHRSGLPGFKELDFAAGENEKSTRVTELIVFLKATILRNKGKAHHEADRKIYDKFADDPRPLRFKK
jgi:general secretion pathway protein D